MSRILILAASLLCATTASATPSAFSESTDFSAALTEAPAMEGMNFLTARMSFADAMRSLTTITLPNLEKVVMPSATRHWSVMPPIDAAKRDAAARVERGTSHTPILN